MNFFQNRKQQAGGLAADAADSIYVNSKLTAEQAYEDSRNDEGYKKDLEQVGAAELLRLEHESSSGVYRTRWLAWGVIATGWIASVAAVIVRGETVEWFMTAVLSMIIMVSGAAPILAAAGITAVRGLSQATTSEGGKVAIQLTIRRSFLIPFVWIAISDQTTNVSSLSRQGLRARSVLVPMLRKESTFHYTLYHLRRGHHPFEYVSVTVGDWLGLTAIEQRIACKAEFVVLPGLSQDQGSLQEEKSDGAGSFAISSRLSGEARESRGEAGRAEIRAAVRAAGIGPESRPYREGDSLRHLDWRSAAKGRGLQTKLHSPQQPVKTCIAVDTLASAYDQDDRLFDACVGWAALAVTQAARAGNGVTLLLGQGHAALESTEDNSNSSLPDMLHAMALLRADGRGSLAGSLAKGTSSLASGCTILVFTADWRGGRSWGELAGYAAEQGCRLELFIVTRSSMPTFAMREQQKWLESGGVKVTWLPVPASMNILPYAEEGGEFYELA